MKNYYSIAIPKPCHEDWNEMSQREKGKFCNSCSKTVIDFTKMDTYEIQDFIHQNRQNNICGHFKQTQLDSINVHIPSKVLEQQYNFHKVFLLALLITMGTSLMNCTNKQGNSQKIDSVEVVDTLNNNKVINVSSGLPVIEKTDSISDKTCSSSNSKKNNLTSAIQVIKPPIVEIGGEIVTVGMIEPIVNENDPIPYNLVDYPPEFQGTDKTLSSKEKKELFIVKLSKFANDNFNLSATVNLGLFGKQRIMTQFKIDEKGHVIDIKARAPHPKLEEEAKRIIQLLPKFIPAKQKGKSVSIVYNLPIIFQVPE